LYSFTPQDFIIYVYVNKKMIGILFPYILDIETNLSALIRDYISNNTDKLDDIKKEIMSDGNKMIPVYKQNLCMIIDNFNKYNCNKYFKQTENSEEKIKSSASFSSLS